MDKAWIKRIKSALFSKRGRKNNIHDPHKRYGDFGRVTRLFIVAYVAAPVLFSCNRVSQDKNMPPNQEIEDTVLVRINTFYHFIKDTFQPAVINGETDQRELQLKFLRARILFKRFEWAAEYFMGYTTRQVNGPPVQEVENADLLNPVLAWAKDPSGLQVMEECLFPRYDTVQKERLVHQLDLLQSNCELYKVYFTGHPMSDWRILDAARLEIFRILTLGITGYDDPLSLNSMKESAAGLESVRDVLGYYTVMDNDSGLIRLINSAITYLEEHTDFNSFNRAEFITKYGNKITIGITKLTQQLSRQFKWSVIRYNRLLNQDAKTLFDSNAFNVNAFAPGQDYFMTKERVTLGKRLFFDPHLSGTGTRSCASCHQPDKSFTDGLAKNTFIDSKKLLGRNTPTLINAALQPDLFDDMRALTLEDQARDVIENKEEMDNSLQRVIAYLRRSKQYKELFSVAYPDNKRETIDTFEVMNALATYVRSLTELNSRFDQYMRGNKSSLTAKEIRGFNLFMGKARCATCHFMPLFNGTNPPDYVESEAEVIGVPQSLTEKVIDPDLGWYNIIGIQFYKHAFKVPTLRNIARTSPYMHNGVFITLKQVMDFYNNGGGAGLGLKIGNQTLSEDSLHLSEGEIQEIIVFMKSLNSLHNK